jgi:alkyl hydroperoxide reductase subunit AhpC
MLRIGEKAPEFVLKGISQDRVADYSLQSFAGKWLVLFFYPADFTFICPTEVIGFSQLAGDFRAEGAEILGISVDSIDSHRNWAKELGGVIPLLSDEAKASAAPMKC